MDFKLKRPCADCPFVTDISFGFAEERAHEIAASLRDGTFPCHKAINYALEDEIDRLNEGTQHCAGAAIMRLKMGRPGRMLQTAERFGLVDFRDYALDTPVFESEHDFVARRARDRQLGTYVLTSSS